MLTIAGYIIIVEKEWIERRQRREHGGGGGEGGRIRVPLWDLSPKYSLVSSY